MVEICLDNMSYHAGPHIILDDMSWTASDKRIAIIGQNGSGKSTLARALAGLIAPTSGSVTVNGFHPSEDRKAAIETIGILFQNPDHQIIFPTVIEELCFGLRESGILPEIATQRAQEILAEFDRADWENRQISTLSHGQKQLVCLMSLLLMTPKLLILDEPFSGLDIPTKVALSQRFDALDQQIIHITHDPDTIADYDRVLWIEEGRIEHYGPPQNVIPKYLEAMYPGTA